MIASSASKEQSRVDGRQHGNYCVNEQASYAGKCIHQQKHKRSDNKRQQLTEYKEILQCLENLLKN